MKIDREQVVTHVVSGVCGAAVVGILGYMLGFGKRQIANLDRRGVADLVLKDVAFQNLVINELQGKLDDQIQKIKDDVTTRRTEIDSQLEGLVGDFAIHKENMEKATNLVVNSEGNIELSSGIVVSGDLTVEGGTFEIKSGKERTVITSKGLKIGDSKSYSQMTSSLMQIAFEPEASEDLETPGTFQVHLDQDDNSRAKLLLGNGDARLTGGAVEASDFKGIKRAEFTTKADGGTSLTLHDAAGRQRIRHHVQAGGGTVVEP